MSEKLTPKLDLNKETQWGTLFCSRSKWCRPGRLSWFLRRSSRLACPNCTFL